MAQPGNMHNLTTLIKRYSNPPSWHCFGNADKSNRLEAATSRLEDIATSVDGPTPNGLSGSTTRDMETTAAVTESTATITAIPETKPPEPLPKSIEAFDKIIDEEVAEYVEASTKIGGLVEEQVSLKKV